MPAKALAVKILYSQWAKNSPLEFYLEEPGNAAIYFFGRFVKFKAHIKIHDKLRPFDLSLPYKQVQKAFKSVPLKARNCKLLRVVIEKKDMGKLEIITWEIIKE